jgi:hypothetical protein
MAFRQAIKRKRKLRLAIISPSGAGKTYSALLLAQGIGGAIGLIDTEAGSSEIYAENFDYQVDTIASPFEPKKYIDCIMAAEAAGIEVLIIDSLSHAWAGEGGIITIADKAGATSKNPYGGWNVATPQHNKLVDAILRYPGHVIVTIRTKTAYEVETNDRGKKAPVKIGLKPIQRDDLEYEFDLIFDLEKKTHTATTDKDRTSLFIGQPPFQITKETGTLLNTRLETGVESMDELCQTLKAEANMEEDKKKWWKEHLPTINLLSATYKDMLIEHLRSTTAPNNGQQGL